MSAPSSTQWSHPRPPTASPELAPGTAAGEYRIERKLGEGGMGTVYQAIHPVIDKRVAVKVLRHELCENQEALQRFVLEARAANRIGHPGIVDVFGFGTTEDGRAFLAMELLTGTSLAARLGRDATRLTTAEACDVLVEVTHALEAAHEAGIVHRDLKPDNIYLVTHRKGGWTVKLLDFGIAKLSTGGMHGAVDSTQPGTMVGTPQYIAPEQARGAPLDGRADIYSLGVVAFELFTGRPPFVSDNPVEMVAKHITLAPPAPSDFNPLLPEVLDQLVAGMLEKDPEARPSLARVRELLGEVREAPPSMHAYEVTARRLQSTKIMPGDELGDAIDAAPPKRRRWWLVPIALGLVAVGARLAVALVDRTDGATPAAASLDDIKVVAPPAPPAATATRVEPIATPPAPAPVDPPASAEPDPIDQALVSLDSPTDAAAATPPRHGKPGKRPLPAPPRKHATATKPIDPKPIDPYAGKATAPKVDAPVDVKPLDTKPEVGRVRNKPDDDDALRSPFEPKQP